jgi:hypothetical protein
MKLQATLPNPLKGEEYKNYSTEGEFIYNNTKFRKKYFGELISGVLGMLLYLFALYNWSINSNVSYLSLFYGVSFLYIFFESFIFARLPKILYKSYSFDYESFKIYV